MSLEEQLAKNTAALEALTGAVLAMAAAGGTTVINNTSAPATTVTKDKTPKGKSGAAAGTRPNPSTVASTTEADPFADTSGGDKGGGGEDDPFGDGGDGGGEPETTLDDVKKKFLATRDAAMAKYGEDEGRAKVRELLNKFALKLDDIKPEQFADAIAACDKALKGMAAKK